MHKKSVYSQEAALSQLKKSDPIMAELIAKIPPPTWHFSDNYFLSLVESIVSQQLSVKAADTIFGRVKALHDSELSAHIVLEIEDQKLRDAGLSWSKVKYVKNIAQYTLDSPTMFEKFPEMSEEFIITELTTIKGVGRWTAEMFLIFTIGRPDVLSVTDLGIRKAIQKLYGFDNEPTKEEMEKVAEKWRPYRSLASRYLWKSLEL